MDPRYANILPSRVSTPDQARAGIALDGAVVVDGIDDHDAVFDFADRFLGDNARRVAAQIDVTKANNERNVKIVEAQPPDARGRKRYLGRPERPLVAHNDGFGFGDYSPDYIILHCERPCSIGGASILVDGLKLVTILTADDPDFAEFLWNVPVDHTEPNFPITHLAPIARTVPSGRAQIRHQPYLAPIPGPDEDRHAGYIKRWMDACEDARDHGPSFRLEAGQMAIVDNYRAFHARTPYVDPQRRLRSVWLWSAAAVRVPDEILNIAEPQALPT